MNVFGRKRTASSSKRQLESALAFGNIQWALNFYHQGKVFISTSLWSNLDFILNLILIFLLVSSPHTPTPALTHTDVLFSSSFRFQLIFEFDFRFICLCYHSNVEASLSMLPLSLLIEATSVVSISTCCKNTLIRAYSAVETNTAVCMHHDITCYMDRFNESISIDAIQSLASFFVLVVTAIAMRTRTTLYSPLLDFAFLLPKCMNRFAAEKKASFSIETVCVYYVLLLLLNHVDKYITAR